MGGRRRTATAAAPLSRRAHCRARDERCRWTGSARTTSSSRWVCTPDQPRTAATSSSTCCAPSTSKYVPLNPGSSFRGLHDSLVNHGGNVDPQLLLCLHEEIAVSLAHGYAKAHRPARRRRHPRPRRPDARLDGRVRRLLRPHAAAASSAAAARSTRRSAVRSTGPTPPPPRPSWSATTSVWDAEPATAGRLRRRRRCAPASGRCRRPQGPAYVSPGRRRAGGARSRRRSPCPTSPCTRPHRRSAADPASHRPRRRGAGRRAERPVVVAGRVGLDPRATAAARRARGAARRARTATTATWSSFPTTHPQNGTGRRRPARRRRRRARDRRASTCPRLLRRGPRSARRAAASAAHRPAGRRPLARRPRAAVVEQRLRHARSPATSSCSPTRSPALAQLRRGAARAGSTARRRAAAARGSSSASPTLRGRSRGTLRGALGRPAPSRRPGWSAETWARRPRRRPTCSACATPAPGPRASGSSPAPAATSATPAAAGSATAPAPSSAAPSPPATAASSASASSATATCSWPSARCGPPSTTSIPALVVVNDNASFYNDEPHQAEVARAPRPAGRRTAGSACASPIRPSTSPGSPAPTAAGPRAPVDRPRRPRPRRSPEAFAAAAGGAVAVVHVRTEPA